MPKILDELLKEVDKSDLAEKVQFICEKIKEEEKDKIKHPNFEPVGPNIFLSLEITPILKKEISFLCLEREFKNKFVVSLWSGYEPTIIEGKERPKRIKVWEIHEDHPNKILKFFAEVYAEYQK